MELRPEPAVSKKKPIRYYVYIANLLLSLHYFLIAYINSTFLSGYFSEKDIGLLYMWGSVLNAIFLVSSGYILRKITVQQLLLLFTTIEFFAILFFASGLSTALIGLFFIAHQASIFMILFALDIYLEDTTDNEEETGSIRGLYLTFSNIMLVISPALVALILTQNQYTLVYFLSAICLVPLLVIARFALPKLSRKDAEVKTEMLESFKLLLRDVNLFRVTIAHLLLQLFYAWMIIYTPLYLHNYLGFEWSEIGIMFTIMLLPFVLFELPLGWIADKKLGEKEIMIAGFVTIAAFTAIMSFTTSTTFLFWTILLFMTRVGASAVEITTESYFFKRIKSSDSNLISIFRTARPLSFIGAPALAALSLSFLPLNYTFLALAVVIASGIYFAAGIKDTR